RPAGPPPSRNGRNGRPAAPPRQSADYGSSDYGSSDYGSSDYSSSDYSSPGGEPDQTSHGPLAGPPEGEASGPFWLRPLRRRR
ncbi:MAG: hypothetical protein ACRDPO_09350, partial [Streptosporangiaceae bacterium]